MLSMTFKSKFYDSSKTMYRNAKTTTKKKHLKRTPTQQESQKWRRLPILLVLAGFFFFFLKKNKQTKKTSHQEQCQKSPGPPTISFRSHVSIPDREALANTQTPLQMYTAAMGLSTVNSPNNCIYK